MSIDTGTKPATAAEVDDLDPVATRTYVLDTSVLLSDPKAIERFAEHAVVLPVVVITELEAKRHHPELGYFARAALRYLDALRIEHGHLDRPVPAGEGGTVRVELNHTDSSALPSGLRLGDNDTRILSVAANLRAEGENVTVVSKDLPMRVKASAVGLDAQEYRAQQVASSGYTGMVTHDASQLDVAKLWNHESGDVPIDSLTAPAALAEVPVNTGVVLRPGTGSGSALAITKPGRVLHHIKGDREAFGVKGRSAEQRIAIEHLLDPEVGIVSLGGRAGTGKSALALAAGLEAVLERREHRKVIVFRPLYAVGGQELGFLPGDAGEKMNPWAQAVFDTLGSVVSSHVVDEVMNRGMLEVLPLTHIRGRSLHDAFVIVDEAQSLERNVPLTVLTRIGQKSKVVLTHDVAQRDNLKVGRHDGIVAVIEALKNNELFAHVTLTRSERSAIAGLVTDLLGEG